MQYEAKTKNTPAERLGQIHRTAWLYWQTGNKKKAQEYFDKMIEYGNESIRLNREYAQFKNAHFDLAGVYAFAGQTEKAYQYLEEYSQVTVVQQWALDLLNGEDPMFESIRKEERFKKIVQQMQARFDAQHDRVQKWLDKKEMKAKVERE